MVTIRHDHNNDSSGGGGGVAPYCLLTLEKGVVADILRGRGGG